MSDTTYKRVLEFLDESSRYQEKDKFSYALNRTLAILKPIVADYNDLVSDAKIDNASVDNRGNLIMTDGGKAYSFTPEKLKQLNKKVKEIGEKKTKAFEPYFATDVPESLQEYQIDIFRGFVIKPEKK